MILPDASSFFGYGANPRKLGAGGAAPI